MLLIGAVLVTVALAGCGAGEPRPRAKQPAKDWKAGAAKACAGWAKTLDGARRLGVMGNVDAMATAAGDDVTALERAVREAPEPVRQDVAAQTEAVRRLVDAVEDRDAAAVRKHAAAVGPVVYRATAALDGAGARCDAHAPKNLVEELNSSFWDTHIRDIWLTTAEELPDGEVDAADLDHAAKALDKALRRAREIPTPRAARRPARTFLQAMADYRDRARLTAEALRAGASDAALKSHFRSLNQGYARLSDAYTDVSTALA